MKRIPKSILHKIQDRQQNGSLRILDDQHDLIDFYSNDYLGLANWESPQKGQAGSTGSRLISGNAKRTESIEEELAQFFLQEAAIFFNSGYDANLGFFSCVPQKGDTVIYDQFIHASIRDGIKLGLSTSYSFRHNDICDLKAKLERATGTIYVAIESVYSMDGDFSPLKEIVDICEVHEAFLVVDEAHAGGVFGAQGRGLVSDAGVDDQIFAKIITFGKAYGSHGAIVLGDAILKSFLVNFSRPLIYTTALSPHAQERIYAAVNKAAQLTNERDLLMKNIALFKRLMLQSDLNLGQSNSPIQIVFIKGNDAAKALATKINQAGFAVKAILHPTVAEGSERLRICIHSYNTAEEIRELTKLLKHD